MVVPPVRADLNECAVSKASYPTMHAIRRQNVERIEKASKKGTTQALMKAFAQLASDSEFLHGQSRATPGVPIRYHECRVDSAPIERRLENPQTPKDYELLAMWHSSEKHGTPLSQTLETISRGAQDFLGLTHEQTDVFVLSNILVCGVTRHEYDWQSFTILVSEPFGLPLGK